MSSFNGRLGGGRSEQRRETDHAAGVPDQWGLPRKGETVEQWYMREKAVADHKLSHTAAAGNGAPSFPAGQALDRQRWDAELARGNAEFREKERQRLAGEEAERQRQLAQARSLKAAEDKRKEEDALLQWAEGQRPKVPGRL